MTGILCSQISGASPYASGLTNNAGIISFYLNESGGNVLITYEDGSTNASYDGLTAGTNLPSGLYTFNLNSHSTYAIAVSKYGGGVAAIEPNVIQNTNTSVYSTNYVLQGFGDPRGLAVNANPASPYFGRIYVSRGGTVATQTRIYDLNSDGSWSTAGSAGSTAGVTTWSLEAHAASPYRISIAADDDLVVGDWSVANAGVWLVDPNLVTNQLLLGPIGAGNGQSAGVHGSEIGRPALLGNLITGATLLTVDGDFPSSQPNSILVYSNITSSVLAAGSGWQNPPTLIGPEVALNLPETAGNGYYFYPSLFVGPNGYIYAGEYRSGVSAGDPAGVQVYDSSVTNQLWTSRYSSGTADYFYTAASGGSKCLPTDLAVSPDGKYLAAVGIDNHFTVCSLTNGIPDTSTIYTIKPDRFGAAQSYGLAAEVAWDAADNLYILSAFNYGVKAWTLGQSVQATTTGNAGGITGFSMLSLLPSISVYATNSPVISQANSYGNPTSGAFTIVRTGGNTSQPLTVNFTYSGTATNGTYTAGATVSVTLAAGQTSTNIAITAVTDGVPRFTTTLTINVSPSSLNYNIVGLGTASMNILNTATDNIIVSAGLNSMYNAFSNDYASVILTRMGDSNATITVNAFTVAGTAVEGTDYTAPTPVTFNPGDLTKTAYIYPLINGQPPVHSATLAYTGNKTVIVGSSGGSGYTAATNTTTLTIVDSALPPETILFADPLTDPTEATNWVILSANDDMANEPLDTDVEFGSDLTATPSYPIPFPPNGSQYALKMTVNKNSGFGGSSAATAVNAYLTNHVFSGNYAVRFNMNVIQGDCTALETGSYNSEEGPLMGINHNGMETNIWFSELKLGAGTTNWAADGLWYWISDSGGRYDNTFSPYVSFTGNGSPSTNTGWALISSAAKTSFATAFKTNVFTSYASSMVPPYNGGWTEGGPGLPVNGTKTLGFSVSSWSDVEIRQYNGVVTLSIDKTPIFTYTNATAFTNGELMLGYDDPYDGGETADTAAYYSNLRVVSIGAPIINNIGLDNVHGNVVMDFSVTDDYSSFSVQSATSVKGPYTTVAATITSLGGGVFQVIVPQNGTIQFYRILQQ